MYLLCITLCDLTTVFTSSFTMSITQVKKENMPQESTVFQNSLAISNQKVQISNPSPQCHSVLSAFLFHPITINWTMIVSHLLLRVHSIVTVCDRKLQGNVMKLFLTGVNRRLTSLKLYDSQKPTLYQD